MPLPPDCLSQLALRQAPFEDPPGPEFIYTDPLLDSLIEMASRRLAAPDAVVLLTGTEGSGRSLQLMRLLGMLGGEAWVLIAFRARSGIGFASIEATIHGQLGGDPDRPLPLALAVDLRAGRRPVIAIDDAHWLSGEVLRQLLRLRDRVLEREGQGPRLLLTGDPDFGARRLGLTDPADEQKVARLSLRPFNREQTGAYLRHRLHAAGLMAPERLLIPEVIDALTISSRGLPGPLNTSATQWLARQCEHLPPAPARPRSPPPSSGKPRAVTVPPAAPAGPRPPWWNRRWFIPALVGSVILAILVPVLLQWPEPPARSSAAPPRPPVAASRIIAPPPRPGSPPAGMGRGVSPPITMAREPTAPAPDTASPPVAPSVPAAVPEPTPALPAPVLEPPAAWLLRQDAGFHTIQLVAAETLGRARAYVEPHGLPDVHYLQTRSFVVALIGSYPDRAAAQQALRELPASVRAGEPWIRTIASVRESLP